MTNSKIDQADIPSSPVETLITKHVYNSHTDFITRLAADTVDDNDPRGVPLIIAKARALIHHDYEGAAVAAGWTVGCDDTEDGTFGYEGHGRFARGIATRGEAARICCEMNDIEAPIAELEHWSVSEKLGAILSSRGEIVDPTFPGAPMWARVRSGALSEDPLLISIASER